MMGRDVEKEGERVGREEIGRGRGIWREKEIKCVYDRERRKER